MKTFAQSTFLKMKNLTYFNKKQLLFSFQILPIVFIFCTFSACKFEAKNNNNSSKSVENTKLNNKGKTTANNKENAELLNCDFAKNGKFQLDDGNGKPTIVIDRKGKIQEEYDPISKETTIFNIVWINDCIAHLTIKEGNERLMFFFKDKTLVLQVEETNLKDKYYIFSTHVRGFEDKIFYQKAMLIE